MKLKFLLFVLFIAGIAHAQEPYRQLLITEACNTDWDNTYIEITNVGDVPVNLSEFKYGVLTYGHTPILDVFNDPFIPASPEYSFMLPDVVLGPGKSFVISGAYDFGREQYAKRPPGFGAVEAPNPRGQEQAADLLIHFAEENGDETDSVTTTPYHYKAVKLGDGGTCIYLEHHFAPGDSAVVDQYAGVFNDNGSNLGNPHGFDVAGIEEATNRGPVVRKAKIKTGNIDFANARGLGEDDSEWIPLPISGRGWNGNWNWREIWWTVGNHGSYVLDENTLESDVIGVDFAGKKLIVPWGIRRMDDIMDHMKKKPGIAWTYDLNPNYEDSLFISAQTGDKLTITVCGDSRQVETFDIVVSPPTADVNIVVPIDHKSSGPGPVTGNTQAGVLSWPRVTTHAHGNDSISGYYYGIEFALRTDTLLKYLEKPANATWEFVWVDGIARPDLKHGDKLRVIAQSGKIKEYFIEMKDYSPSHNAYLSSITWPDIPEDYRGMFGWVGDTIPGFGAGNYNYTITVPLGVDGIPALVANTASLNATVKVKRATSLSGSKEDRTLSFIVTAEDDSVTNTYNIEFVKEIDPTKVQPFNAEPFIAEFIYHESWSNNYVDIVNPGNQPLDLSNYMFIMNNGTDFTAQIGAAMLPESWPSRFIKYTPGYKWVSESQWQITPGIMEPDLAVNPILAPGDVFTMGRRPSGFETQSWIPDYKWPVIGNVDVQFYQRDDILNNPWNEPVTGSTCVSGGPTSTFYILKILNDSIKQGLKPANDPYDFQIIDVWGMQDGSFWTINGRRAADINTYIRKPYIYEPNPVVQASFGTNDDDSEWLFRNNAYWSSHGSPWPGSQPKVNVVNDIGRHTMDEPTHYKSTISSINYKVSEGYSWEETIRGVKSNTTVTDFLASIIKANPGQTLTLKSTTGKILEPAEKVNLNDTLIVMSADSANFTKYILDVTQKGFSSNAILTSSQYYIGVDWIAGSINQIPYGTSIKTVLQNVVLPAGASLTVIDKDDKYVPLKMMNFDSAYVDVVVSDKIYFEVVAEDGVTKIIYQLVPTATASDAFVTSVLYSVDQAEGFIDLIPWGTSLAAFLSNVYPVIGASVKVVDKAGFQRTMGGISIDDKLVVTSKDGKTTKVYYLSMLHGDLYTTQYLAYVLSDVYQVNQENMVISGPTSETTLTDFNAKIWAAFGSTAVVVNAQGEVSTAADLNRGDRVRVTSADGKIVVFYDLQLDYTSLADPGNGTLRVYPNPTSGKVNILGLEQGTRVQVFTPAGALIRDTQCDQSIETISLDNQPAGIYLMILTKETRVIGRCKVIRK